MLPALDTQRTVLPPSVQALAHRTLPCPFARRKLRQQRSRDHSTRYLGGGTRWIPRWYLKIWKTTMWTTRWAMFQKAMLENQCPDRCSRLWKIIHKPKKHGELPKITPGYSGEIDVVSLNHVMFQKIIESLGSYVMWQTQYSINQMKSDFRCLRSKHHNISWSDT